MPHHYKAGPNNTDFKRSFAKVQLEFTSGKQRDFERNFLKQPFNIP